MPNGKVTLEQVYNIINRLEDQMNGRFDELSECMRKDEERITALEMFKVELVSKITIVVAIVTLSINLFWDSFKEKIGLK